MHVGKLCVSMDQRTHTAAQASKSEMFVLVKHISVSSIHPFLPLYPFYNFYGFTGCREKKYKAALTDISTDGRRTFFESQAQH